MTTYLNRHAVNSKCFNIMYNLMRRCLYLFIVTAVILLSGLLHLLSPSVSSLKITSNKVTRGHLRLPLTWAHISSGHVSYVSCILFLCPLSAPVYTVNSGISANFLLLLFVMNALISNGRYGAECCEGPWFIYFIIFLSIKYFHSALFSGLWQQVIWTHTYMDRKAKTFLTVKKFH